MPTRGSGERTCVGSNALLRAGWRLLRFTAADVYRHPETVVAQVRAARTAAA